MTEKQRMLQALRKAKGIGLIMRPMSEITPVIKMSIRPLSFPFTFGEKEEYLNDLTIDLTDFKTDIPHEMEMELPRLKKLRLRGF